MRWAALYRRPPILRGVSALQIRADHAANQARVTGNALVRCRRENVADERIGVGGKNSRSVHSATPDFLWTLMPLADLMRLSLRERRTRGLVLRCVAGNPGSLRLELVIFLSSGLVCGRKAPKSICQQASPGFPRLRSGQALRLRAIKPSVCDRSAKRFAPTPRRGRQDDNGEVCGPVGAGHTNGAPQIPR